MFSMIQEQSMSESNLKLKFEFIVQKKSVWENKEISPAKREISEEMLSQSFKKLKFDIPSKTIANGISNCVQTEFEKNISTQTDFEYNETQRLKADFNSKLKL